MLANRMKVLLSQLILVEQGAFINGRHIYDNSLLTQEVMYYLKKAPLYRSMVMLKMDIDKAYI